MLEALITTCLTLDPHLISGSWERQMYLREHNLHVVESLEPLETDLTVEL